MHATLRLLGDSFPALRRARLETLQVNLGYRCNQACLHCHVNAGPTRKETMTRATMDQVIAFMEASGVDRLDLTGGAPELNPGFRDLVHAARARGVHVIDRCNLTVLELPEHAALPGFLAEHAVEVIASLPCYLEQNVDAQRGRGVYAASIRALKQLNALGYGQPRSRLKLNLVHNPAGAALPPAQATLEEAYRRELGNRHGIVFHQLFTLTNMPIQRFGSTLVSQGRFEDYMRLLKTAHRDENLAAVMCRSLVSVDWQGYVYDCDFNQMLGVPLRAGHRPRTHITELTGAKLEGLPIRVADHCYGCTTGQGSSCDGALA
ncbi:MAG: arsenosugar biosynthesis radical SAM protein ArsS [Burkholderiales bacterium]|nr:arsenosugar biosynthesis radical SAM protein ArsS [Burkholderiales bacterium]